MTDTNCVICGSLASQSVFLAPGFDDPNETFEVVKCTECGLVHTHKPKEPIGTYYESHYYGTQDAKFSPLIESLVHQTYRTRTKAIKRLLGKKKNFRVLDIGCGRGGFLKAAQRVGGECVGVEIPEFEFGPQKEGIEYLHGPLEKLSLKENSFDVISIWHVLEHAEDPVKMLREASRLLKEQGALLLAVPNFSSLQSKTFGPHWFHLDLPRHLFHFSKEKTLSLLEQMGFEIRETHTNSYDQNLYGFIQSSLNFLFPDRPNELYSLLKVGEKCSTISVLQKAKNLLLGGLLFPASLIENLVSVYLGKGATLIVFATKKTSQ